MADYSGGRWYVLVSVLRSKGPGIQKGSRGGEKRKFDQKHSELVNIETGMNNKRGGVYMCAVMIMHMIWEGGGGGS